MFSIAIVDDDPAMRELWRDLLTDEGYTPYLFDGTDGIYQGIRAVSPAAVILDLPLAQPEAAGALLDRLSTDPALEHAAFIICTGDESGLEEHRAALQRHPYAVLPTPCDIGALAALLQHLLRQPARGLSRAGCVW